MFKVNNKDTGTKPMASFCCLYCFIRWSSYRKLAWVGFEPRPLNYHWIMTTELSGHEFNSHSEPILYSYSNFIFCSVSDFTSAIAFVSYHVYFNWNVREVITWVLGNELIHLVFITERSFEVAIESWPEWNLNLRPLTSVQML